MALRPRRLVELLGDPDPGRAARARDAMLRMRRISIADLESAADETAATERRRGPRPPTETRGTIGRRPAASTPAPAPEGRTVPP